MRILDDILLRTGGCLVSSVCELIKCREWIGFLKVFGLQKKRKKKKEVSNGLNQMDRLEVEFVVHHRV